MINEAQVRRTFDLLGRWIGRQYNIKIDFSPGCTPMCDVKNKRIILPGNIDVNHIFPALAELIHEAGHIRHTTFDAKKICSNQEEFQILNAVEDIRVDNKNMGVLPNMNGIHGTLMEQCAKKLTPKERKKLPFEARVLSHLIYEQEGFGSLCDDKEAHEFTDMHGLGGKVNTLISTLENSLYNSAGYDSAKRQLLEIKKILYKAKKKNPKQKGGQGDNGGEGEQSADSKGTGSNGDQGTARGSTKSHTNAGRQSKAGSKPDQAGSTGNRQGTQRLNLGAVKGHGFSENFNIDRNARSVPDIIGTEALEEITRTNFIELLKVKDHRTVNLGKKLDSNRLVSYKTGDIDTLFTDEKIERPLRSKVLILLDCSGSMASPLLDNVQKSRGLADITERITKLLDELNDIHGIDIDYDVRSFDTSYYTHRKEDWKKEYLAMPGGGTSLSRNFDKAQDEMLKDYTVNGKKMIVVITDGDVGSGQVEHMRQSILGKNEDVRLMILGIGADPIGQFSKEISGHNILAMEMADTIVLDAIMEML